MRCFRGGAPETPAPPPLPPPPPQPPAETVCEEDDTDTGRSSSKRRDDSPALSRSSAPTSAAATSPSTSATINLSREYTLAMQTNSYSEIWAKIHPQGEGEFRRDGLESEEDGAAASSAGAHHLLVRLLQPDPASVEEALSAAPPSRLTRLVTDYFDRSEHTSRLCLSLRDAVDRARSLYAPIADLLDLLPSPSAAHLSEAQCEWAFDAFLAFDRLDNPFPAPAPSSFEDDDSDAASGFRGMRGSFSDLRGQLDLRLRRARRRHRLLRGATRGSAACLVAATAAVAVAGLAIASHALAALAAGPAFFLGGGDLLARTRRRLREHMAQLDAAARGTYVLNNDLDTIERLVARLHATVEGDKGLVRLGLERGRGQRHPIEEVVRQLRKNHPSFLLQLGDLEEHICLYFAAVNRARSLLLQEIHQQRHHHNS